MKYRIKETQLWYGKRFIVQVPLGFFFWVNYNHNSIFETLKEAKQFVKSIIKNEV
jgi:hypothetical protein